ncbi:SRPBCC domain-containing protein [Alkalimonas collagenimarina]|uniref:SRPBCC domain-containing protein n=1 Tax=Alkalimonas collagenimarina TaxID=400390 RepID=A0ABT9H188_9GAMM|nr:SRPBCC domain-containing protein [Alkalimonas collagenimarina]MDP4537060.1 SRPBCC domain-containing protein [Alkalimonas collagenimarina]
MVNIEHIQYVNATASQVYQALTTEAGLAAIWTQELVFTAEVDAINEFRFGDETPTKMQITKLTPNQGMSWLCVNSDPEWIGTSVHFQLHETGGKTSVTLRHTDWRELTDFYRFCNYNWAIFLLSLKEYCEAGTGINYQVRKF